eukprot:6338576-Amphidinium_carterae.1
MSHLWRWLLSTAVALFSGLSLSRLGVCNGHFTNFHTASSALRNAHFVVLGCIATGLITGVGLELLAERLSGPNVDSAALQLVGVLFASTLMPGLARNWERDNENACLQRLQQSMKLKHGGKTTTHAPSQSNARGTWPFVAPFLSAFRTSRDYTVRNSCNLVSRSDVCGWRWRMNGRDCTEAVIEHLVLPNGKTEGAWRRHEAAKLTCVAAVLMAHGSAFWAVPPNPQHPHSLACEYLLLLAFWLWCAAPEWGQQSRGGIQLAQLWLLHGCAASFGIAVEQLPVSSDSMVKQSTVASSVWKAAQSSNQLFV